MQGSRKVNDTFKSFMRIIKTYSLDGVKNFVLYTLFFLIPIHTIGILWREKLGSPGEEIGFVWQYGVVGVYLFDLLIGLLVIFALSSFFMRIFQKKFSLQKIYTDSISIVIFLLGGVICISIVVASQKVVALMYGVRFFEVLFLFQTIRTSTVSVSRCAWIFMSAGAIQGILATWQFFMQHIPAVSLLGIAYHSPQELGDSVVAYGQYRWLRAYGSFPHPNFLASFLACSFASSWYLIRTVQEKRKLWIVLFCTLGISSGFFLTFSRNAWIGMAGMIIIWSVMFFVRKKIKDTNDAIQTKQIRPWMLFMFVVMCVWGAFSIMFFEIVTTRLGIGGWQKLEQRSLDERRSSLVEALELIKLHPLGVGLGNTTVALFQKDKEKGIQKYIYSYQPIHSSYLHVATELGIGGGLIFIGLLVFLFLRIGRGAHKNISSASKELLLYGGGIMVFLSWNLMFDHFFISLASGGILLWSWLGLVYLTTSRNE